ncbi:MAG: class I SAM-dependent methyltransferase [Candidatus Microgenomates bacterium]|jgi:23S rRNA (cytosine1962-C5)-methyltransferase
MELFYELVDSGNGKRLERYGKYLLDRPDPQIIWKKTLSEDDWQKADAIFQKLTENKGRWIVKTNIPEKWELEYNDIKFWSKLSPFKHTGVFPEQTEQWDYIYEKIKGESHEVKVLNLFAYTGIASLFAAKAGAKVTHVDASKPAITWANENRELNDKNLPIRWIIDDAIKFTSREIKRGIKYDAIIMDPPIYGHGPAGEIWDFNKDFPILLFNCKQILSDNPLFVLVNAYAISSSSITLANTLNDYFGSLGGNIENGELTLKEKSAGRLLSTGIWARWSK